MKVLVVDDETGIRITLTDDLVADGHEVTAVDDGLKALKELEKKKFECVISDIRLPGCGGLDILRKAKELDENTDVILITGYASIENAIEAMRLGASDYLLKPFLNEEVVLQLRKIDEFRRVREGFQELSKENVQLKDELRNRYQLKNFIADSQRMRQALETIEAVARTEATILIVGESGTGKEMAAHAIHARSTRANKPLVKFSCAALPEALLESELFGYEKGAFTDAKTSKIGRFERADGGTIFIDDIDDMSLATQVKLLRVLQNREFERLGGGKTIQVDIRIIAASKIELGIAVEEGKFREDLFYRLNVVPIDLPPLRERKEDIPLLAEHFIKLYGQGDTYKIAPDIMDQLVQYSWPGNIRELENSVERAVVLAPPDKTLRLEHLLRRSGGKTARETKKFSMRRLSDVVRDSETEHIRFVLGQVDNQKSKAAEVLGVSRKTLWEKMRLYGIE